jgi:predicted glycosyltransferase
MKILFYCQHVLGIGHLFRSLEICRALSRHAVTLVTGGPAVAAALPANVVEHRLPELGMDPEFKGLRTAAGGGDPAPVLAERRRRLLGLFEALRPDLFLLELYPFGRKAFAAEIDPVLEAVSAGAFPGCGVVCSVRDILVEKERPEKHEGRAVAVVNRHFDAVLVHADPRLARLEETFGRLAEIRVPVVTTGLIAPEPPPGARERVRGLLGLAEDRPLVVASAGSGSVGRPLLAAVLRAFARLEIPGGARLLVFTGPLMPDGEVAALRRLAAPGASVERFTPDFLAHLAAADLSVSMGGYNTCMNLLAARTPALVWPFAQNREQRLRVERLEALGALERLGDAELEPGRLAGRMRAALAGGRRPAPGLDLGGAAATARWIEAWHASRRAPGGAA